MFKVARDDAEKQICEKLQQKLDEFLKLQDYDWNLIEPQGHASKFITNIIPFLQNTFASFSNLPVRSKFLIAKNIQFTSINKFICK